MPVRVGKESTMMRILATRQKQTRNLYATQERIKAGYKHRIVSPNSHLSKSTISRLNERGEITKNQTSTTNRLGAEGKMIDVKI